MPKHIIEFNLPEESEELKITLQAMENSIRIEDIWNECFRPCFKHGYADEEMNELLGNKDYGDKVYRAVEILADIYRRTKRED
jgi:hypothetical protein